MAKLQVDSLRLICPTTRFAGEPRSRGEERECNGTWNKCEGSASVLCRESPLHEAPALLGSLQRQAETAGE